MKEARLVDFRPRGHIVNSQIKYLNEQVLKCSPQEHSDLLASTIAACAFVLMSSNSPAKVKELFNGVINDAAEQFKARQELLKNGVPSETIVPRA